MSVQAELFERADAKPPKQLAKVVEEIVAGGFDTRLFFDNFEVMAQATGGLKRVRELAIEVATRGLFLEESVRSSWREVQLADVVVEFQNGISKRRGDRGAPVPVLRLADIEAGVRLREVDLREIVLTAEEQQKYRVRRGDILVIRVNGSGDLVGRFIPCEVNRDWAYSDHLIRLRLHSDLVDPSFLSAISRSAAARTHLASRTVTTAGQKTINQQGLGSLRFLLPPLAEQKRIVAKVEQLMARCDELEARQIRKRETGTRLTESALGALTTAEGPDEFEVAWKRVVENFGVLINRAESVSRLRATILELAMTGRFSSRASGGVPDKWATVTVGEVAIKVTDGDHLTPRREDRGRYLLSARNVRDGAIDLADVDFVPEEEFVRMRRRCDPNAGDILLSCSGSIGRVAIVDRNDQYAMVRSAAMIRPNPDVVTSRYLHFALRSPGVQRQMLDKSRASAQANLFIGKIKELSFPLAPLPEQTQIVAKVENLMRVCDELESRLRRAEDSAAKLVEAVVQELVA